MAERLVLPIVVAAGLALIVATGIAGERGSERLRARAAAAGHATTQLAIREMG